MKPIVVGMTGATDVIYGIRLLQVLCEKSIKVHWVLNGRGGTVFLPPMGAFYFRPKTIDDIVAHTVRKVWDLLDAENNLFAPWAGRE